MNAQRRSWLLGGAMVATAAFAAWYQPRPTPEALAAAQVPLESVFPERLPGWQLDPVAAGLVRPAFDVARRFQMYDQVLERIYVNDRGEQIMLSAAYGRMQSVGLQMHRPEVCYRAGGFTVENVNRTRVQVSAVASLPVTRLVAHLNDRHEPITYWQMLGRRVMDDDAQFRGEQLRLGLQRLLPDGMLVRVSSLDDNPDHAWAVQARFVRDMAAALQGDARLRVLGEQVGP
ncbi:MAG: hypothetical protein RI907_1829 [Pseudomonadota bacterium]|jgi:EpsI family protein